MDYVDHRPAVRGDGVGVRWTLGSVDSSTPRVDLFLDGISALFISLYRGVSRWY